MRGRPTHEKSPGEKNHREATEADQSPGEGERQQGQKEKGQDPLLRWLEGHIQKPTPEAKTTECGTHSATEQTGRPKDDTKTTLGLAGKAAPTNPTVPIPSFEIRSVDPDPIGVTPS